MARTAIPTTTMTAETVTAPVLSTMGVAIDATNSHSITLAAGVDPRECFIFVYHTTASTKTVTLKAGAYPLAIRQGQGDLVGSFTDGSVTPTLGWIPLSGSRFAQADGTYNVDIQASATGRIAVVRIPRNV